MKKLNKTILVFLCFLFCVRVCALENVFNFKEDNNKLYYDSSLVNDFFKKRKEISPGKVYRDTLTIKNGSRNDYTLYLKFKQNSDSIMENKIINSLIFKIYLNNKIIYDGNIKGQNYNDINLNGGVKLFKIKTHEKKKIKLEISLPSNYDNIGNFDSIYGEFEFYGYNDKLIKIQPLTQKIVLLPFIITIVIMILGFAIYKYKNKKKISEINTEETHII